MSPIARYARHSLLVGAALTLMSCGSNATATGNSPQDLSGLRDFTAVSLAGPDRVVVKQGASFSVTAQGDARALARLELKVRDKTLEIGRKRDWRSIMPGSDGGATITVTLPALREAALAGSGDMSIDLLTGKEVEAHVAGSGDLTIARIAADSAELGTAGSGTLTASGQVRKAELSVAGSGGILASGLAAQTAELSLAGSGDVQARVSGQADISIVGSGNATVSGTAKCSVSRIGSGDVRCGA